MLKLITALVFIATAHAAHAESLNLKVRLPNIGRFPEGSQPRLIVTLWGYDNLLADAPASELRTIQKKLSAREQNFAIPVEADIANDIDQGMERVFEPRFYVSAGVDMNGDGKLCAGDLRQDYDDSSDTSFETFPSPQIELVMKVISKSEGCDDDRR